MTNAEFVFAASIQRNSRHSTDEEACNEQGMSYQHWIEWLSMSYDLLATF